MDEGFSAPQSGDMETFESLVRAEFAPKNTYLNTASTGLLPTRTVTAMRTAIEAAAVGTPTDMFDDVEASRAAFARLADVPVGRVAAGASVAVYSGLIASSLPAGAEVLTAEADFSSVVNPFHMRPDLKVRSVPLERIAESVRPGTALVAVSAAQSADGRIADLPALRAAAREHGARTYVDASQAVGWFDLDAGAYDYVAAVGFKWLFCPRGVAFLVTPADLGGLNPIFMRLGGGRGTLGQLLRPGRGTRPLRPPVRREPGSLLLRRCPPLPRAAGGVGRGGRTHPRPDPRRPLPRGPRRPRP